MNAKLSSFFKSNVGVILALVIGVGWIGFEYTNFVTTSRALAGIMGSNDISLALALAIAAIDFGGLARIATPSINRKSEPLIVKALFTAWTIVAMLNATLTWWDMAVMMESNPFIAPSSVVAAGFLWLAPVVLAIIVFTVRFILIYTFGAVLDNAMNKQSHRQEQRSSEREVPNGFKSIPNHSPQSNSQRALDRMMSGD